jgi:tetratricopeptide (TPR) repeat protein
MKIVCIFCFVLLGCSKRGPKEVSTMTDKLSVNDQAAICYYFGKYARAEGLYKWDIISKQEKLGFRHPEVASCLNNLAAVYDAQGRFSEAEKLYMDALAIITESDDPKDADFRMTTLNLADSYRIQESLMTAWTVLEGLLPASKGDRELSPSGRAEVLNSLALIRQAEGRLDEAEELLKEAVAAAPKPGQIRYSGSTPVISYASTSTYLNNLGALHIAQGRYNEAEVCCKQALELMEAEWGPDHHFVRGPLNNLLEICKAQEGHVEADQIQQRLRVLPPARRFSVRRLKANPTAVSEAIRSLRGQDFVPKSHYHMNRPTNPNQEKSEQKPLDQWGKTGFTCVNKANSNVVDIEITYDLNSLWASVVADPSINLRCFHSRDRIHEVAYFWLCIYSEEDKSYVKGEEGEGRQFIGGYYWGLFAKKDGTPLRTSLLVPPKCGPGRYHAELRTRLGTWDYC